jgi:hypothetical protein
VNNSKWDTISLPVIPTFLKNPASDSKSTFRSTAATAMLGRKTCRILSFFLILF